jgi:tungstate transport system substrate-binding protein
VLAAAKKTATGALRLATTTSTRDSGLLDVINPIFEKQHSARIDVIAVGTGQALKLGENGDADVVLVHARSAEDAFMEAGHGVRREDVMYNTFEILGPPSDPAGIKGLDAVPALQKITQGKHPFVSRGDNSGTHVKELELWKAGGGVSEWDGYSESGQGMGETLIIADQAQGYTLSDRGTYLAFKDKVELVPLTKTSEELKNPYGVIVVNPDKINLIQHDLAQAYADFLISRETQQKISEFQIGGEQLFYPHHLLAPK